MYRVPPLRVNRFIVKEVGVSAGPVKHSDACVNVFKQTKDIIGDYFDTVAVPLLPALALYNVAAIFS